MRRTKSNAGMTLTELMIAVGLIGALAAIAIPSFITYQARARRGEAFTNVKAIATAETSYFSENGIYFEVGSFPVAVSADLGTQANGWTAAAENAFEDLGWRPEGRVRYNYDVNTGATGCAGCNDLCFTASAVGDVEGDGFLGAVLYAHPVLDAGGTLQDCGSGLLPALGPPIKPGGGVVYDEAVVHYGADDY